MKNKKSGIQRLDLIRLCGELAPKVSRIINIGKGFERVTTTRVQRQVRRGGIMPVAKFSLVQVVLGSFSFPKYRSDCYVIK